MSQLTEATDGSSTLRVVIRSRRQVLELVVLGPLDDWTVDALVRDLVATHEPCHSEIHLDLRHVESLTAKAVEGLARCRAFARARGAELRISLTD